MDHPTQRLASPNSRVTTEEPIGLPTDHPTQRLDSLPPLGTRYFVAAPSPLLSLSAVPRAAELEPELPPIGTALPPGRQPQAQAETTRDRRGWGVWCALTSSSRCYSFLGS